MVSIVKHRCTIKLVVVFWCKSHSDSFRVPKQTLRTLQYTQVMHTSVM
jgi:hypothetical protein